ncbi:hypothetical protein KIPB_009158 [Kipferlia bialata]|uniref:Uncharacterized protein n=1 Tax=Kipferlia bialata TaxID=797122 RepID=A0A9K3D4M2_9EUKA|nr:hypothetical protein KIPB_009158 [Kipferlia bialata]|eukprot:g9158.t1
MECPPHCSCVEWHEHMVYIDGYPGQALVDMGALDGNTVLALMGSSVEGPPSHDLVLLARQDSESDFEVGEVLGPAPKGVNRDSKMVHIGGKVYISAISPDTDTTSGEDSADPLSPPNADVEGTSASEPVSGEGSAHTPSTSDSGTPVCMHVLDIASRQWTRCDMPESVMQSIRDRVCVAFELDSKLVWGGGRALWVYDPSTAEWSTPWEGLDATEGGRGLEVLERVSVIRGTAHLLGGHFHYTLNADGWQRMPDTPMGTMHTVCLPQIDPTHLLFMQSEVMPDGEDGGIVYAYDTTSGNWYREGLLVTSFSYLYCSTALSPTETLASIGITPHPSHPGGDVLVSLRLTEPSCDSSDPIWLPSTIDNPL